MSEENVEIVRRYYDALARLGAAGDPELPGEALEEAIAVWAEDCEWRPDAAALVEGSSFRGHEGMKRYFTMLAEVMESSAAASACAKRAQRDGPLVGRADLSRWISTLSSKRARRVRGTTRPPRSRTSSEDAGSPSNRLETGPGHGALFMPRVVSAASPSMALRVLSAALSRSPPIPDGVEGLAPSGPA